MLNEKGGSALGKNACDIASPGETLYRRHQKLDNDSAATGNQSNRVVDKGDRDLRSKCLHFESLRVI
jgi:hypothetical protein